MNFKYLIDICKIFTDNVAAQKVRAVAACKVRAVAKFAGANSSRASAKTGGVRRHPRASKSAGAARKSGGVRRHPRAGKSAAAHKSAAALLLAAFAVTTAAQAQSFPPLKALPYDETLAKIGRELFFDINLTPQKLSCNDCHDLNLSGSGSSFAGINTDGELNPPTVLNIANSSVFFGDGQVRTLHEQVRKTLLRQPGVDEAFITRAIANNSDYKRAFGQLGMKANYDSAALALAEFERALITPGAAIDEYLSGEFHAISPKAKEGLRMFKFLGCASCHSGVNFGSEVISAVATNPICDDASVQRKVPTLRNITLSAPYGHRGEYLELEDMVRAMILCQANTIAEDEQVDAIMEFLKTLEGQRPRILKEYD